MKQLTDGDYSKALDKTELAQTLKVATEYAKKNFSDKLTENDLELADDDSKQYDKYPLYGKGRIIIYTFVDNGIVRYVAVGRINVDSEWKVLENQERKSR